MWLNKLFAIALLLLLTPGCNNSSSRIPEPDLAERLVYDKAVADTFFKNNPGRLIVMAKIQDREKPVQVSIQDFPGKVEIDFNIIKDQEGRIIRISEFPYNKDGSGNLIFTHYFDKNGNTYAFERRSSVFNSPCTGGAAFETKTAYYNDDFQLVKTSYLLTDEIDNILNDSCRLSYNYVYEPSGSLESYLKITKLEINR